MKRVLAFIGSPRKLGNCEIMVKEISRNIPEPHELRVLRLTDFDLQPCRGCYACLFNGKGCVIKDQFHFVFDEILQADAYIAAAPTYFLGPASVMKRLTDRHLALYPHAEKLWGRPAVSVSVTGIKGREGYTALGLESFLKLLLADIKASREIYGALPGEIFYGAEAKTAAAQLGASLFGKRETRGGPSCPLCGGQTFRFTGDSSVCCMLCSNYGTLTFEKGVPHFEIATGEHEMFTSLESAVAHREWLKGMKERFLSEKDALKQIVVGYLEDGTKVLPVP